MNARRTPPAVPFWAMLAAVWALLVLGAVPPAQAGSVCRAARHGHPGHQDCIVCCPCTLTGQAQAILATPAGLPAPRGTPLSTPSLSVASDPAVAPAPLVRARAPPIVA